MSDRYQEWLAHSTGEINPPEEPDELDAALQQAFKVEHKGFVAEAFWGDSADARIVVTRDGQPHKEFTYPAYKIFNIAAHWQDIVESELKDSDAGYRAAGSDLFGGGVMPKLVGKAARIPDQALAGEHTATAVAGVAEERTVSQPPTPEFGCRPGCTGCGSPGCSAGGGMGQL